MSQVPNQPQNLPPVLLFSKRRIPLRFKPYGHIQSAAWFCKLSFGGTRAASSVCSLLVGLWSGKGRQEPVTKAMCPQSLKY